MKQRQNFKRCGLFNLVSLHASSLNDFLCTRTVSCFGKLLCHLYHLVISRKRKANRTQKHTAACIHKAAAVVPTKDNQSDNTSSKHPAVCKIMSTVQGMSFIGMKLHYAI